MTCLARTWLILSQSALHKSSFQKFVSNSLIATVPHAPLCAQRVKIVRLSGSTMFI